MDLKLLKQIEYASRKDSLSEHERLLSVRSLVTAAISRTEATASTKSEGGVEGHATTPIGLGEARKAKPMSCSIQEGSHGARAGIKPGPSDPLPASSGTMAGEALKALKAAKQFIENGVELGYIRMPGADLPDPAHNTLSIINAALAPPPTGEMWLGGTPTDTRLPNYNQDLSAQYSAAIDKLNRTTDREMNEPLPSATRSALPRPRSLPSGESKPPVMSATGGADTTELREALEPFAVAYTNLDPNFPDSMSVKISLSVGSLRRAANARYGCTLKQQMPNGDCP